MSQPTTFAVYPELNRDLAAASSTNFCSLWPAGKAALQALLAVVSNPLAKAAIGTVIAVADGLCPQCAAAGETSPDVTLSKQRIIDQLRAKGIDSLDALAGQIASCAPSQALVDADTIFLHSDVAICK